MEKLLLCLAAVPFGIGFLVSADAAQPEDGDVVLTFADEQIVESSGLVVRQGLVVTVNDSGDRNRIFTVDPTTGGTVGMTEWQGEADDIEALAPADEGHVYVGDIGDNANRRERIQIARVPFGPGDSEVEAQTFDLVYPDGSHDAETLLTHPRSGQVFVVAKAFIGRLYAAPEQLDEGRVNRLTAVDEVLGIATDGAFFPDGRHLVLRNYTQAAVYTWPALDRVALIDLPSQPQGEGIAVSEEGEVLISSEGQGTDVLRVALPEEVRAQVASGAPPASSAAPSEESSTAATPAPTDAGESAPVERDWWPWALGAVAGLVIVVMLLRSLRPR
ncbi:MULTISPECIES: hypothetical protein [Nocardioides]|uniref:WD40 repeat domain-containing protein n=1 Tax=Nocardioides vastitatis TaxID=2568655 RepID=A0ABW0ZM40_9ACTN|nr:hypothetical protein [Nocardioides sp.]THI97258.1 hypothetical protein E7Z54_14895 [Nocardioides sp.]